MSNRVACLYPAPENKILSIKEIVYLWETVFMYAIYSLQNKSILFQKLKDSWYKTSAMWQSAFSIYVMT